MNFEDTITEVELDQNGKIRALKGKCKAGDLRRTKW